MSVRQRDKSLDPKVSQKWQLIVETGFDTEGNRKRIYREFIGTKKQAEREEARLYSEAKRGFVADPGKLTVEELLTRWFNTKKEKLARKTALRYDGIIKDHLVPGLGTIRVSKLSAMHIDEFLTKERTEGRKDKKKKALGTGLSESSLKQAYNILHSALEKAIDWDLLNVNPCRKVEKPKLKPSQVKILETTQVLPMLEALRGQYIFMPAYISIFTGMRLGEILALTWNDVDLTKGLIYVSVSSDQVKADDPTYKDPKTRKGKRAIAITKRFVKELKEQKKQLAKMKLEAGGEIKAGGKWEEHDLVCPRWDEPGKPINPPSFSGRFSEVMEELGYKITFHGLRHTHASLLIQAKEQPKVISDRLGHTNIGVTMDTYGHLMPGAQEEAATKLDALLFPPEPTEEETLTTS